MNTKRDFFMDALMNLIWLAVFYGIFVAPTVIFLELPVDVLLLASAVAMVFFFLVRRLIRPIVPMLLVHIIAPIAVFYFVSEIFWLLMLVGVTLVFAVFSLQQRHTRSDTFAPSFTYISPIILVILALVVGSQGHGYLYMTYAILIIFACLGSKLHIRMTHVSDSLEVITQTSTQPVKKILAFDYKAMVVFCLVMIGMIIFLHVFLMRPAIELISGIQINLQVDLADTDDDYIPEPAPQAPSLPGGMDLSELFEERGPSIIWVVLEWILFIVAPPLIIAGIGFVLFRVAREIYRRLGVKTNRDHDHASGYEDIKEFIRTPKVKRSWFFGSRNEHKLRRLFRETVTRHIKKGAPIIKSDTPVQMAEKIQVEDFNNLAEEYAAVRYGKP